jgi:hypothetical protein
MLVDHVTAPAIELDQGLQYEPIQDDKELLAKALAVGDELDKEITRQAEVIYLAIPEEAPVIRRDWSEFKRHVDDGAIENNWDYLLQKSISVDPRWFADITRSMLRNRPVEVEVATASRSREVIEDKNDHTLVECMGSLFTQHEAGIQFGAMLRRIQGFEYVRPVVAVDDLFSDTMPPEQDIISSTYHRLGRIGVLGSNDTPGRDFLLLPYSRSSARTNELIQQLDESESGLVATYSDGRVFLRPNKRVFDSMVEQYNSGDSRLYRSGVLLRDANGSPSRAALEAASYLDPINADFTHVRFRDTSIKDGLGNFTVRKRDAENLSIILQTLHITHPDRDHTIFYDSRFCKPRWAVYALTHLLRHEVDKVVRSIGELDNVSKAMKPKDYFDHNYNSETGMWPEDAQGIRAIGSELPLHYGRGEIESAAIIGYGPFSYPGIAIAPFMAEGAKIDISDLLQSNIDFAKEWFSDQAEESHSDVYRRFAEQFRSAKQSGHFYTDAEQRLKETGNLHVAALENLPSESAQVVLESFVSCSSNIERYGFYESIRQKARVMTWTRRSMMVSVHMVGSGGWNNSGDHEGVKIPATNLTIGSIEDGYRSAGLRVVNCVPLHADSNFREDYKGMVVIFAKPDTIERPISLDI